MAKMSRPTLSLRRSSWSLNLTPSIIHMVNESLPRFLLIVLQIHSPKGSPPTPGGYCLAPALMLQGGDGQNAASGICHQRTGTKQSPAAHQPLPGQRSSWVRVRFPCAPTRARQPGLPPSFPGHSPFLMASVHPHRPKPRGSHPSALSSTAVHCLQAEFKFSPGFCSEFRKRRRGGRIGGSRLVGRGRGEAERGGL